MIPEVLAAFLIKPKPEAIKPPVNPAAVCDRQGAQEVYNCLGGRATVKDTPNGISATHSDSGTRLFQTTGPELIFPTVNNFTITARRTESGGLFVTENKPLPELRRPRTSGQ